jgi:excisionase family DNA binding protein
MDVMHMMTVADFCQTIGISRSTWHKLKRTGQTPAIITVGGIQRIRREAFKEWIAKNEGRAVADTAHKASKGPCEVKTRYDERSNR